ncbi:MAG TPA: isoprenylcysteine carboxylmethyltransferase family protein [Acidimicrobiia bacterium]|nr:isoprenylcysteine carboxylmethyltransferase family protein [Acidimicrobiia bacterium]
MTTSDRRQGWVLVALQFVLLAVIVVGPAGGVWVVPGPLRTAGTVMRVVGAAAIAAGALRLGRGLSVHPTPTGAAVLRTDGPYRFVRHPIYSGVLLLATGITATSGSAAAIAALAGLAVLLNVKARFEEDLLRRRFPDYGTYASRTPRFIPSFPHR